MGEVENENKFKKYLYFLTESQQFIVPKKENNFNKKIDSLLNLLAAEKINKIVEIIEEASKFEWLPSRNVLFHVLALCTRTSDKAEVKIAAYSCAARLIKTADDLFEFITYERALQKNAAAGLRRVIKVWYLEENTDKLFEVITGTRSVHGWTHRDALRVAHVRATDLSKKVLLAYACRGLEHARKEADGKCIDLIEKLETVEQWRRCKDEQKAIELASKSGTHLKHIPGALAKSNALWTALIPNMSLDQLINELVRFHRLGMLRPGQSAMSSVVQALGDSAKCRGSGLTPAAVLLRMKQFERPQPMDPKLREHLQAIAKQKEAAASGETAAAGEEAAEGAAQPADKPAYSRSHAVTAALGRLLHHSLRNVRPLPPARRPRLCLLTVEVRGGGAEGAKDGLLRPCFGCAPVRYGEAAALLMLQLQRLLSAQHVLLACFSGPDVVAVQLPDQAAAGDKGAACLTLAQVLQKLRETGAQCKAGAVPARPLRWAADNHKQVDLFVNVLVTGDGAGRVPKPDRHKEEAGHIADVLFKYRQKAKLPNTRMLNIALCGRTLHNLTQTTPNCPGLLNVVGFNPLVPAILNSFLASPLL